jgi:hypothetical protein
MFATARALVLADEIKNFVPLCEKTLNDSPNPKTLQVTFPRWPSRVKLGSDWKRLAS